MCEFCILDKLKKKTHTPEDGTPRSPGNTPKSYVDDDEDEIQQLAVKDEDLAAVSGHAQLLRF